MSVSTSRKIKAPEVTEIIDEVDDILTIIAGCAMLMEADIAQGKANVNDIAVINASVNRGAAMTRRLRAMTAR